MISKYLQIDPMPCSMKTNISQLNSKTCSDRSKLKEYSTAPLNNKTNKMRRQNNNNGHCIWKLKVICRNSQDSSLSSLEKMGNTMFKICSSSNTCRKLRMENRNILLDNNLWLFSSLFKCFNLTMVALIVLVPIFLNKMYKVFNKSNKSNNQINKLYNPALNRKKAKISKAIKKVNKKSDLLSYYLPISISNISLIL